jgi:hypothetical protein
MDVQQRQDDAVCPCEGCRKAPGGRAAEDHRAIHRVLALLDERGRRLFAGLLAARQGRGGIELVARVTGLSRNTIRRGVRELHRPPSILAGRVRRPGGGRKPAAPRAADPGDPPSHPAPGEPGGPDPSNPT